MQHTPPPFDEKLHWYKDAIIYELHIKAFCDSNSDGTGDFAGLLEKLDYLENLGVTAIWVLPFYPSPLRDDGYDIADYYSINPAYGNILQFRKFLEAAHSRNLKVITELVINHTSDQHPWFLRARKAPKGSPERNYYVWTDDPNQYKDVRIIFQDFEASNWAWDPVAQQYYWHRFFHHQPDLNFDNPVVQEEVFRLMDYWCAMGVDGFRLDAVPYLFEREGTNGENLPETHAFLKKLRKHVDDKYPGTVFLAEANMWPEDSASYFGDGDECHMNYHFPVMPRIFMALRMEDRYPVTDIFEQTPEIPESCQWAIFLRNHDELTLEMVTDEERDYMYKVYAKDPKARINLGIRHRLAPLMENNRRKIELLNCLLFSLRGTPVIYYGDEIGMGDNFYLGDRDGVRTPMQWSPDRNAGFSKANPQQLYLPLILDPEYHYGSVNVETQLRNPSSLLWFMKKMIKMRKQYKAFGRGDMKFINLDNPKVLAFTRTYDDQTMLVIVNLSRYSQPAEIDLVAFKGYQPIEVFSKNLFPVIKEGAPYFFTLDSYTYEWFLLEKVPDGDIQNTSLQLLTVEDWTDIGEQDILDNLCNRILPAYLPKAPWYLGKQRIVNGIAISNTTEIIADGKSVFLLLVEVSYENGLPETYLLPVTMMTEPEAAAITGDFPNAVISRIKTSDTEALLCDGVFSPQFHHALLKMMGEGSVIQQNNNELSAEAHPSLQQYITEHTDIKSKVVQSLRAYTAIVFDNCFFVKIYRLIERSVNPDVEMTRYFSNGQLSGLIPEWKGSVRWMFDKDVVTIGMVQNLVEYHGNGSTYMQERLNNLNDKIFARNKESLPSFQYNGGFMKPIDYATLPEHLREFLGAPLAEGARMIGVRLANMHSTLAAEYAIRDFTPENFSLHYQRSLYAGMQTLVRTVFQTLSRKLHRLPADVQADATELLTRRHEILAILKNIYSSKFDITKTRIHGFFHLEQVLFTGKDIAVPYLGGDPARSFSERRLKRSPLKDVASMITSFYYAAQSALRNGNAADHDISLLSPYYSIWTRYVSGFFMHSYLQSLQAASFLPAEKSDLELLLRIYLLEDALQSLQQELTHRTESAGIAIGLIRSLLTEVQHDAPREAGGQ